MGEDYGIWIDQRLAILVRLDGDERGVETIESGVERRSRLSGGARSRSPFGPQEIADEWRQDRRRSRQRERFFLRLLDRVRRAGSIDLVGPGETKVEFRKFLRKARGAVPRLVGFGTVGKLTTPQLKALLTRRLQTH